MDMDFSLVESLPDYRNNDNILISNNPPDDLWIQDNERRYTNIKATIMYDVRIYVDVPYDADDAFKDSVQQLNDLRPLNPFDHERLSFKKQDEILEIQQEIVFLWLKYCITKCIDRRTSIPNYLQYEESFRIQSYVATICNQYVQQKTHDDDEIFFQFKQRIQKIEFNGFYDKETCINIVNGYIGHSRKLFIPSVVNDICLLYFSYVNIMYAFCDDNGDVNKNAKGCMTLFHSNNLNDFIKMLVKHVIKDKYGFSMDMANIRLWMKNNKTETYCEWLLFDSKNYQMSLWRLLKKNNIELSSNMCFMIDIKNGNTNEWSKMVVDSNYYPDFKYPSQLKDLLDMGGLELDIAKRRLIKHRGNLSQILQDIYITQ
eukprot:59915_1